LTLRSAERAADAPRRRRVGPSHRRPPKWAGNARLAALCVLFRSQGRDLYAEYAEPPGRRPAPRRACDPPTRPTAAAAFCPPHALERRRWIAGRCGAL